MKLLAIFVVLAACSMALAQDTSGINTSDNNGTVVKGKAPVAKDLLKVRFPKPTVFKLSNGIRVFVLEDHRAPAVRLSLQIRAGREFEPKPGVAALTASTLTEGTTTRSDTQIAEDLEDLGANIGANAGLETTTVSASGLSESTEKLIGMMADVLLHPTFPTARVDRAKFTESSNSGQRGTNPTAIIGELQNALFYGGTKYARRAASRKDIAAITQEDLKTFYTMYYTPDGAIIGVTGDVNPRTLHAQLEAALGSWKPTGTTATSPPSEIKPRGSAHIYLVDRPGSAQSVLQFGTMAVSQTDPDFIPLVVANRILGGGSSGRLFQEIRERKGYTYGAYSSFAAQSYPAVWGANASVRTAVTEPAVGEFFMEFKLLQDQKVSDVELNAAKRSIIGGFALTLQNSEGILGRTLEQVQNSLPANYWDTYAERIDKVTPDDIQRVARKYLGQPIQLLVVGERKQIEEGLAKYGTVQVVDPATVDFSATR